MQNQQQAMQALTTWQQTVDAAHAQAIAQAAPAPSFLESVGEGIEDVVNGAASLGQAALDNPEAVVELAGGLALAAGGYALATGGVVVSATGVGAIAGVPAAGAGWALAGVGGLAAMDGARRLAEAAGQNPAAPVQMDMGLFKSREEKLQDQLEQQAERAAREQNAYNEKFKNGGKIPKGTDIPSMKERLTGKK